MFFNLKSEYFSLVVIDAVIDMQVLPREHYVVSVATHCYCIPWALQFLKFLPWHSLAFLAWQHHPWVGRPSRRWTRCSRSRRSSQSSLLSMWSSYRQKMCRFPQLRWKEQHDDSCNQYSFSFTMNQKVDFLGAGSGSMTDFLQMGSETWLELLF